MSLMVCTSYYSKPGTSPKEAFNITRSLINISPEQAPPIRAPNFKTKTHPNLTVVGRLQGRLFLGPLHFQERAANNQSVLLLYQGLESIPEVGKHLCPSNITH